MKRLAIWTDTTFDVRLCNRLVEYVLKLDCDRLYVTLIDEVDMTLAEHLFVSGIACEVRLPLPRKIYLSYLKERDQRTYRRVLQIIENASVVHETLPICDLDADRFFLEGTIRRLQRYRCLKETFHEDNVTVLFAAADNEMGMLHYAQIERMRCKEHPCVRMHRWFPSEPSVDNCV